MFCLIDVNRLFLFHRDLAVLVGVTVFTDKILAPSFKAVPMPTCLRTPTAPGLLSRRPRSHVSTAALPVCQLGDGCLLARITRANKHDPSLCLQHSLDSCPIFLTRFLTKTRTMLICIQSPYHKQGSCSGSRGHPPPLPPTPVWCPLRILKILQVDSGQEGHVFLPLPLVCTSGAQCPSSSNPLPPSLAGPNPALTLGNDLSVPWWVLWACNVVLSACQGQAFGHSRTRSFEGLRSEVT